jgi:ATP-dependent DNA helicase RecQ
VDEIAAYAQTVRCRHGHLNAYLGGRTIERCSACDNCVEIQPPPDASLPDEREQLLTILRSVSAAPWSWGRLSLVRILRGDPRAPDKARHHEGFGALAFRSATVVGHLLDRLQHGGFLQARQLDHGGVVLDITPAGKAALQNPAALDDLIHPAKDTPPPKSSQKRKSPKKKDETGLDVDEALFQTLRAWQLEQARAQGVPPHFVFHRSHLRAIAAHQPVTLEALSELKGVGPAKLEKYGAAVIERVRKHLEGGADDAQAQD